MKELRDRNVILTGASRGLGVHLARAVAEEAERRLGATWLSRS